MPKPRVSWTDKVAGHPDNLVWGEVSDPDLLAVAIEFGAPKGGSWSRKRTFAFISDNMPAGWKWEG